MKLDYKRIIPIVLLCLLLGISTIKAQEVWDLQKCIDFGVENNVDIELALLKIENARLDFEQQNLSWLPTVNANINPRFTAGQQQLANAGFANNNVVSIGFGVIAQGDIYNFGRIKKGKESFVYTLQSVEKSLEKAKADLSIQISNAYINVLLAGKQQEVFLLNIEQDHYNLEQTKKMVRAGIKTDFDLIEIERQLAQDSANFQNASLQRNQNLLNLKILMNLNPSLEIEVFEYQIDSTMYGGFEKENPQEVFEKAVEILPLKSMWDDNVKAAEYKYESSKSGLYPRLSYALGYNTFTTFVGPDYKTTYFREQLNLFGSYYASLTLTIPIFDAWSVRGPLRKAKTQIKIQKATAIKEINQLRQEVFLAVQSADNAYQKYKSNDRLFQKSQEALEGAKKRYEAGVLNITDYILQQNAAARSKVESISAFYDYYFKKKIIDFYKGIPVNL